MYNKHDNFDIRSYDIYTSTTQQIISGNNTINQINQNTLNHINTYIVYQLLIFTTAIMLTILYKLIFKNKKNTQHNNTLNI